MAGEYLLCHRAHHALALSRLKVARHDGKGLGGAPLALAQKLYGGAVRGVAAQVEPSDALDGYDATVRDDAACLRDGRTTPLGAVKEVGGGSTVVAAHGLCVVPARLWAVVLAGAGGAHRKD